MFHHPKLVCGFAISILFAMASAADAQIIPTFNHSTVGVVSNATRLAIGDLDRDGDPDLVASTFHTVSIAHGDGAGSFGIPTPITVVFSLGAASADALAIGDVNGDSIQDIVVFTTGVLSGPLFSDFAALKLLIGNGSGGYTLSTAALYNPSPPNGVGGTVVSDTFKPSSQAILRDFDGDGILDVAVAFTSNFSHFNGIGYVTATLYQWIIWKGSGTGSFSTMSTTTVTPTLRDLAAADVDCDGTVDVAALTDSGLFIYPNLGNGSFGSPVPTATPGFSWRMALADVNNDDWVDFVVGNIISSQVNVVLGNGTTSPGPVVTTLLPKAPAVVASHDWNGDGVLDFSFYHTTSPPTVTRLWIAPGLGTGSFGSASQVTPTAFDSANEIEASDQDGDGREDLMSANATVEIYMNQTPFAPTAASYGIGSPGCGGIIGIEANEDAHVGSNSFVIDATNVPPLSLGLGMVCDVPDFAGSDVFSLNGLLVHLDVFGSSYLVGFDIVSGTDGQAAALLPIPNDTSLAGQVAFVQTFWYDPKCDLQHYGLHSSRGFAFLILP